MTRFIIVRHGETTWNAERRYQGQTDIPLSELGHQQAAALGSRLATDKIDVTYASDLCRTKETAEAVMAYHSGSISFDLRLREMSFGDWEGLTFNEMQEREPRLSNGWANFMLTYGPPAGESIPIFAERLNTAIHTILKDHPDETVLLVAHGGAISVLLCLLLDIPLEKYWQFRISQVSVTKIETFPDGAILNLLNDTCHLEPKT